MSFIIGLLTMVLLLNALMLILLVLVQLPKKDAGAGLAFGGGAADALFGAGSGNALTKITKWGIVTFILITLAVGYLQNKTYNNNGDSADFLKKMSASPAAFPVSTPPVQPVAPAAVPSTNGMSMIPVLNTNSVISVITNSAK